MNKLLFLFTLLVFNRSFIYPQWVKTGSINDAVIMSLFVSGSTMLAGTYEKGIFLSTNYGETWKQTSLKKYTINCFAVKSSYIFAGSDGVGIYLSTDNGMNWEHKEAVEDEYQLRFEVKTLAITGNKIIAGTNFWVFISTNSGDSWVHKALKNETVFALAVNDKYAFAACWEMYISELNLKKWRKTTFPKLYGVFSLLADGTNIYAGSYERGVYFSSDNGENWVLTKLNNKMVYSLAYADKIIFASVDKEGIYYSHDNGENWLQKNEGLSKLDNKNIVAANEHLYVVNNGNEIWKRLLTDFKKEH